MSSYLASLTVAACNTMGSDPTGIPTVDNLYTAVSPPSVDLPPLLLIDLGYSLFSI